MAYAKEEDGHGPNVYSGDLKRSQEYQEVRGEIVLFDAVS